MNSRFVTFIDPSPMEDKKYIKQLMREMIPLKKMWGGLATVKIAKDEELLDLAAESGCKGLLIGFETIGRFKGLIELRAIIGLGRGEGFLAQQAFINQATPIFLHHGIVCFDFFIHGRLGKGRFIALIMAVAAIAEHVDDDRL